MRKFRRAVSPVIAIILLISLTVAASAIIYGITNGLIGNNTTRLIVDNVAVADTDADGIGDYISMIIRNIGSVDAKLDTVELKRDGTVLDSWVVENPPITIKSTSTNIVNILTLTASHQVNKNHEVEFTLSGEGFLAQGDVVVPDVLASLPVFFENNNFNSINIASAGWTVYSYQNHGGAAAVSVSGGDIVLDTNHDLLFYLKNDTQKVKNGIITLSLEYGDNDGIGIAFRIVDELNYYWVGYTLDHNGPGDCGCDPGSYNGPDFIATATFELHQLVNGVDTLLSSGTSSGFTITAGSAGNLKGPFDFVISFSDGDIAFQAGLTGGSLEEILTYNNATQFPNAGYFGAISIAAQNSRLNAFTVTA